MILTETIATRTATARERLAAATRTVVFQSAVFWAVTRVLWLIFTYFAILFAHDKTPVTPLAPFTILRGWEQWDSDWYFAIARYGYYSKEATVYFPLYPALLHLGISVFGERSLLVVSLVISYAGSLAAFIGLGLLAAHEFKGREAALPAVRTLAAYPLALFLAAPYTEGLFLGLLAWALLCMRREWWYGAAACAYFAALARPTGLILALPLCWEYGRRQGWWTALALRWRARRHWRDDLREDLMALRVWRPSRAAFAAVGRAGLVWGAVPLGIGTFALYCWARYHDPLAFLHEESAWFHQTMPVWQTLGYVKDYYATIPPWTYYQARFFVDIVPLVLFAVVTVLGMVRRWPFAYTLFMVTLLIECLISPTINGSFPFPLMSVSRYLLAALPVFLYVGQWSRRRPWLEQIVIIGGFMFQALFTAFYLNGGWIV
jgi:hypothetical protein